MKLYHAPRSRSFRARWMLEELSVPYELSVLNLKEKEQLKPEYLKINPQGTVPMLEDGEIRIIESGAIIHYLAEKYVDKGLLPPLGPSRAQYYQWMFYAVSTLEPIVMSYYDHTEKLPPEQRQYPVAELSWKRFERCAKVLAQYLEKKEYLVDNKFSAADLLLGSMINLARVLKMLDGYPVLNQYVDRLRARPAFRKSLQD